MAVGKNRALEMMQETLDSLHRGGLLPAALSLTPKSILLGTGSPLDSIGFVTFVAELEERVAKEARKDTYLVLDDIQQFSVDEPELSAEKLAEYIETVTH